MTNKFSNAPKPTLDTIPGSLDLTSQVTGTLPVAKGGSGVVASNPVIQRVSTQTGAVATGTTTMPNDDTIPQKTEGDEYMTLSITPKNTANILKIEVTVHSSNSNAGAIYMIAGLFQDTTAGALAASMHLSPSTTALVHDTFTHTMTAGTTSATTFKVRIGGNSAGTTTFNGVGAARRFGGIMASSIVITEYAA